MISYDTAEALSDIPSAVFFVEVLDLVTGDIGLGTAFHIGGGYFVTARHVVERKKIRLVGRADMSMKTVLAPDKSATYTTTHGAFEVGGEQVDNVYFHPNPAVDVAILKLKGNVPQGLGYAIEQIQPVAHLCSLADTITEGELLMAEVIVLGFPRIPKSQPHPPSLVAYRGDISSTITSSINGRRHLIVTGMARGGFSGGPVLLLRGPMIKDYKFPHVQTSGNVIGVVVKSLVDSTASGGTEASREELGFTTAISAEAVIEVAKHYGHPTHLVNA